MFSSSGGLTDRGVFRLWIQDKVHLAWAFTESKLDDNDDLKATINWAVNPYKAQNIDNNSNSVLLLEEEVNNPVLLFYYSTFNVSCRQLDQAF